MPLRVRTTIALCLAALGCGGGGDGVTGPAPIATLSVDLAQSSIVIGATTTATATAKDASGNLLTGRVMSWSSNNSGVATVSATGVVVAVSAGTAGITAASEGRSGTATVTVIVPPVASVTVSLASSTITVGSATQATATTKDANGQVLTGRAVSWSSDNTSVATVSTAGVVTAVSAGTAGITAASEGRSGTATVTVVVPPVASVTVSLASSTIGVGQTTPATATTKDANGNVLVGRSVTWSSDNTSIATVSTGTVSTGTVSTSVVFGVATGTANITATSEGQSGFAGITVAPPLGFGSSSEKIRIVDIGSVFTPTLSGPSSTTTTLVSRATSVATVNAQGTITGVGEGQVWVAATAPGWVADSVYVIVPRTFTGPVLRSDLTTFNVTAGSQIVINIILDTRSTPIGGAELSVGYTTSPNIFTSGSWAATGSPAPVVSNLQAGVFRLSLASGSPLTGALAMLRLTFTARNSPASGFLTLTLIDLVSPTGADLLPVSTSTRIPIIIQ
jgi:trimeric autotransporter adhesin